MGNDQTNVAAIQGATGNANGLVNVYGQGVPASSTDNATQNAAANDPMQSYISNASNVPMTPYSNSPNPVINPGVVTQTSAGPVLDANTVSQKVDLGNISVNNVSQSDPAVSTFQSVPALSSQNVNTTAVSQNSTPVNMPGIVSTPIQSTSTDDNATSKPEQDSQKDEMTPLQSLAKKLSDLKAQFIVDGEDTNSAQDDKSAKVPEEEVKIPQNLMEIKNAMQSSAHPSVTTTTVTTVTTPVPNPIQTTVIASSVPASNIVSEQPVSPSPEIPSMSLKDLTTNISNEVLNKTTTNSVSAAQTPQPTQPEASSQSAPASQISLNTEMPDFLTASLSETKKEVKDIADSSASVTSVPSVSKETVVEEVSVPVPLSEIPGYSASDTWVAKATAQPNNLIDENTTPANNTLSGNQTKVKNKRYSYSIDQLLDIVIERKGSDLHIQTGYPAMVRVDGSLLPVSKDIVTVENIAELILPVMDEEKRDRLEVNREVDLAYAHGDKARFRVNAFHQKQTMAAAFRLIPSKIKSLADLQLPPIYTELSKMHQGLVLVTGPTGHGKSTTLAAIIQEINNTRDSHILTIEDPIEYIFPPARALIAQREIQDDTHSWDIALKSALREDPDVILVGEMRDYETISAVITLAETGHLVFATLHTNSAAQTIDRIIDVFPENQQSQVRAQLANVVEAVIAQRLIPLDKGGRKAASEIMLVNPAVRTLIREGKTHQLDNVIRTSADQGMVSLESSLVKLVRDNEITMDKAMMYSLRPEEIVRLLKG